MHASKLRLPGKGIQNIVLVLMWEKSGRILNLNTNNAFQYLLSFCSLVQMYNLTLTFSLMSGRFSINLIQ